MPNVLGTGLRCGWRPSMIRRAPTRRPVCRVTQVVLLPGPVIPSSTTAPAADSPFRERLVRARATDVVAPPLLLLALASCFV